MSNRKMVDERNRSRRGRPRAEERRPDTRQQLLDAAAKVIAGRGYKAATVDAVIAEAGLSKGTFYWHFDSKEDLFFSLLEERIDRPGRELMELLESAPADRDMAPEASYLLTGLLQRERQTMLLDHEYWSAAARDPRLRKRYAARQVRQREALAKALRARAQHLGAPPFDTPAEDIATAYLALANGLAAASLIDTAAVPDHLFGEIVALVYQGLLARTQRQP
jgi:AcrR family transcriptional regulator